MAIEKPDYEVILKEGDFEIRQYEPMIIALSREENLGGGSGFNKLFGYISGKNTAQEKISMTAPVLNDLDNENMTIAFVMPKNYDLENLPQPQDSGVELVEKPRRKVAAIRFSGNPRPSKIAEKTRELSEWMKEKDLIGIGMVELARYNPPFIPGFMKHNEVLIEIESD